LDGTTWVNSYIYSYTRDTNGNITISIGGSWFVAFWLYDFRNKHTYDANGKETKWITEDWDNVWVINDSSNYFYDTNGNKTTEVFNDWNGTDWDSGNKYHQTLNANGNKIASRSHSWNGTTWVNSYQDTFYFDANNNMVGHLNQRGNGPGWVNNEKCDFYFSQTDSATCSAHFDLFADTIPQNYIGVNQTWGASPLNYLWNWGDNTYDSIPYPEHTYDSAGYYTICLTITDSTGCTDTYCDSYNLRKMMGAMVQFTMIPGISVGLRDYDKPEASFKVLPNPANQYVKIQLPVSLASVSIHIYNLMGVLCGSSILNDQDSRIDISRLIPGTYVIEVHIGNKIYRQKFVKVSW